MRFLAALLAVVVASPAYSTELVEVGELSGNPVLTVDGEPFFVRGMNWGYVPIGQNYSYDFWGQPPEFIEQALRYEMGLVQAAGVNAIRQYDTIPPEWVEWIYDNYGIHTAINPLIGRYGATIQGRWVARVDYSDPTTRQVLTDMTLASVDKYKDTRGVLLYMLGNESNYGLEWSSFEIEALPKDEQHAAKAVYLYSLYGEITEKAQAMDPNHPVAIVNGDLLYIDLIAEHMPTLDIMGTNVYRGISARDLYQEVQDKLGIPVMYTEFGSDAYNARLGREDHLFQAKYVHGQWQEIYEQSATQGRVGNAIGGFQFQWSDGWWKYKQEENLDVHDPNASWPNGGYPEDFVEGGNNMNEEWFGICAKGPPDATGMFQLYPRASYYVLRDAWKLDPYAEGVTDGQIQTHFEAIRPQSYDQTYRASLSAGKIEELSKVRLKNARMDLRTYTTGDTAYKNDTPAFDHLQSFYTDIEIAPTDTVRGHVEFNILGNVPVNPIDDIFYENRGRDVTTFDEDGNVVSLSSLERLRVYRAGVDMDLPGFQLVSFYREGHFHWGYEGDFWGLYPEAFYGPNLDLYDGIAPVGMELRGKKKMEPFTVAMGPQLYWGANPSAFGKYYDQFGAFEVGVVQQVDFATQPQVATSLAVPERPNTRTGMMVSWSKYGVTAEWGGLIGGLNRLGEDFSYVRESSGPQSYNGSGYDVIDDRIEFKDTLGTKLKLTLQKGRLNWYGQGMVKGLVADTGVDGRQNFGGYTLRESGRGNQVHGSTGVMLPAGMFTVAPNFRIQKPLIGPNPVIEDRFDSESGLLYPAVTPRNVLADPFAVLDNQESIGGELVLTYDPTPGTWMWMWDNDLREDAAFAASLNLVYISNKTSRDGNLGWSEEGFIFGFPGGPPAADVWSANLRWISAVSDDLRIISKTRVAADQSRGVDERLIRSVSSDMTVHGRHISWVGYAAFGAWGPFDYHRDYNLTFPFQSRMELSYRLSPARFEVPPTRFGTAVKYRTLNEYSQPFASGNPGTFGAEWEWMTFLEVTL